MRGHSIHLNGDIPITSITLSSLGRLMGARLRELEIVDVQKFSDTAFAKMVEGLPSLTTLILR